MSFDHVREMWRSTRYLLPLMLSLGMPLVTLLPTQAGQPVFVVAAPWSDPVRTIDLVGRADGAVLRGTAIPWIAVAVSPRPDFPARLRRAGAWIVVNAALVTGCGPVAD